jgi:hypothetical protein
MASCHASFGLIFYLHFVLKIMFEFLVDEVFNSDSQNRNRLSLESS